MAKKDYISVTGDDWYQRRRQDAEGRFFCSMADQGPRKDEGGSTRQGIYCLTAGGKLLAYRNAGQNTEVMRQTLRQGLQGWGKLPESERSPGGVGVEEQGEPDRSYHREPPPNGLILNVHVRSLDRDDDGKFSNATCKAGAGSEASRDHLWLTEEEWKSLLPPNPKEGGDFPMPSRIAERILRFHLVDNTRGEPPMWQRDQIRSQDMKFLVEEVRPEGILLRLEGFAMLATDADLGKAERGYDARLLGYLRYDAKKKAINRFDIVVVGSHWGEGTYTRGARPGKTPLGIAFELTRGDSASNRVPPQGARDLREYFSRK